MKEAEVLWRLAEEVDWQPLCVRAEPRQGAARDGVWDATLSVRWDDPWLRLAGAVARDAKPATLAAAGGRAGCWAAAAAGRTRASTGRRSSRPTSRRRSSATCSRAASAGST